MTIAPELIRLAIKKAVKSSCHQKVSAIGINWKGDVIMTANNSPRFSRLGGGRHAEMKIMAKRPTVKTIIICRTNREGDIRPIDPCVACKRKADELGIRILTVEG
jgi:cytidine deaminase